MMNSKIEISKFDIKSQQITTWVATTISMLPILIMLVFNFTFNTLIMFFLCLAFNIAMQYWNIKIWNIWYQEGVIYCQNIYSKKEINIKNFEKIVMTSAFGNNYCLYTKNGESYNFRLKQTDDFKLLFKIDSQYYAKKLTQKLSELQ